MELSGITAKIIASIADQPVRLACCALLLSAQLPVAQAATASNTVNMSVIVPAQVQLSATAMSFGNTFNPQTTLQASASVTVNITASQVFNITLDGGLNLSGERRMTDGAGHFRSYLLYKDAARTQLWGDADFAASYVGGTSVGAIGTGAAQSFNVYGTSPSATPLQQPAGIYNDAVTVTVHY